MHPDPADDPDNDPIVRLLRDEADRLNRQFPDPAPPELPRFEPDWMTGSVMCTWMARHHSGRCRRPAQ